MSEPSKAVFLSYASQDAVAVQRIAEALRAGGVEVWFDADGGLEHGDEWDAKIRRQIKECVLFIPVISANTQAREEGYFRLEWDLAAERARTIASGVPFILPVVIDATREPDALVPDRFRAVQWMRLRGGEVPLEVQQRFLKLWSHRTGVLKNEAAQTSPRPIFRAPPAAESTGTAGGQKWVLIALLLILVGGGGWWLFRRPSPSPAVATAATTSSEVKTAAMDAAQLTDRAYALTLKVGFTRDDLSVATDLTRRATELESGSGRAWAVRAWVQGCYLMRNWDLGAAKLQEVQALANRALSLAPRDADAMNALYQVFEKQRAGAEAEKIARRAIEVAPDNYRSRLCLGRALAQQGRFDESLVVLREAAQRFPTNVLCRYELAATYASIGNVGRPVTPAARDASLEQLDAAIAIQPFASAILLKAETVAAWSGDLALMRRELDRMETMPLADRTEDRAVFIAMWAGLLERRPDRVLEAAKLTTRPYFEDGVVAGPKAWGTALAYQVAGKEGLARQEWLAAEATLRLLVKDAGAASADTLRLAATLAWLGRMDEAAQLAAPVEAAWREDLSRRNARLLALYYGARGDATKAVPYLRQAINYNSFLSDYVLPLDPWWDKLRAQPEFEALLAEAKARIQAAEGGGQKTTAAPDAKSAPADKSIAVLAFADLSAAKDSEYLSDGISEELLNTLAKIPNLGVAARTSAFSFKGKNVPIPEIAQKLNVAYVVEGSVQRAGDRVKITAQLIKAADGFHVWSDTFTRDLKDVFAIEEEISGLIAKNLSLKLGITIAPPVASAAPTKNSAAFEAYLRGRAAQLGIERSEAVDYYETAIHLDPDYALAWARLAETGVSYFNTGFDRGNEQNNKTRSAAATALRLDANLPEAHLAQALVHLTIDRDLARARRELDKVEQLRPGEVEVPAVRVQIAYAAGEWGDPLASLVTRAVEADPQNVANLVQMSSTLIAIGHFAEANRLCDRAAAAGESGEVTIWQRQVILLAWTGDAAAALAVLETMPAPLRKNNIRFFISLADNRARLGDIDGAIADYEQTCASARQFPNRSGPRSAVIAALYRMALLEAGRRHADRATQLETEVLAEVEQYRRDFPEAAGAPRYGAYVLAHRGHAAEALAIMDELDRRAADSHDAETILAQRRNKAVALALIGRIGDAVAELRAVHEAGYGFGYTLRTTEEYEPMRNDPRFQQLMKEAEARADAQPRPKK